MCESLNFNLLYRTPHRPHYESNQRVAEQRTAPWVLVAQNVRKFHSFRRGGVRSQERHLWALSASKLQLHLEVDQWPLGLAL